MSLSLYSPRLFSELAQLYTVQGRYDEAEPIYIDALNMLRDTLPKNSWCVGRCLSQLGQLAKLRNQDDKAEATYVCVCVRVRAYTSVCVSVSVLCSGPDVFAYVLYSLTLRSGSLSHAASSQR